eukprot:3976389-Pyramimonas_sp.AAC.1
MAPTGRRPAAAGQFKMPGQMQSLTTSGPAAQFRVAVAGGGAAAAAFAWARCASICSAPATAPRPRGTSGGDDGL